MTRPSVGKKIAAREAYWRERIAAQQRSGLSVKRFCEEQRLTEQSFYVWRKRLQKEPPMRFALVETGRTLPQAAIERVIELVLATGDRLRICSGVDVPTLHTVLEALRA